MFPDLLEHPGLLYVAATLLPVASFVLLLLAGGLRATLRPRPEGGGGGSLYELLGGDRPVRAGAYVATGAIGLAFVLSLIGFVWFSQDYAALHQEHHAEHAAATDHGEAAAAGHDQDADKLREQFESRWKGSVSWAWVSPGGISDSGRGTLLTLGYRIDHLTATMFLMVTFIAWLIHIFSIGYMGDELQPIVEDHQVHTEHGHLHRRGRFGRFFLFLSLFCFSMLNLILADNLFQIFISWELVGLCSYLLIGFYYERRSASDAANKAFITNRVGDAGFIIGVMILWTYVGTLNFEDIFHQIRAPLRDAQHTQLEMAGKVIRADGPDVGDERQLTIAPAGSQVLLFPVKGLGATDTQDGKPIPPSATAADVHEGKTIHVSDNPRPNAFGSIPYWLLVVAGMGIFLGCVGKSAQFPLHVWLPDAMEGPTPVSALIHAATMVAAGVYLVGRCFPLFVHESRLVIAYTGGITLFVAATIALVMTDIKKVLAYSTVSQLGYMMLALGVGGWVAGLFHLITHAFFKALLFLCSGSVIYGCHHEQDMFKMGGLFPKMRITALTMLVGVLTIAGTPLFSGWYSKDAILANAFGFFRAHPEHFLLFVLPLITAGITSFYMFRMWFLTFTGEPRDHHMYEHAHESPRVMTTPLIILAVCSVAIAWGWPVWDAEKSWLEGHLHHQLHDAPYLSVRADFDNINPEQTNPTVHSYAREGHFQVGLLALGIVAVAITFAYLLYYRRVLDPAEAKEAFPAVHAFLWYKWYFDEFYSVALVRPALVVAGWCRAFDTYVIDGTVNFLGRFTVRVSDWEGWFDSWVVDGLVNLTGDALFGLGVKLRNVQTGYLRSYVLFLVLAAIGIFALMSYFVARATAGLP
jgi:NADH-quinone oxidoreductase subunit L